MTNATRRPHNILSTPEHYFHVILSRPEAYGEAGSYIYFTLEAFAKEATNIGENELLIAVMEVERRADGTWMQTDVTEKACDLYLKNFEGGVDDTPEWLPERIARNHKEWIEEGLAGAASYAKHVAGMQGRVW